MKWTENDRLRTTIIKAVMACFGWLIPSLLFPQAPNIEFEHITSDQGLSQSVIHCIFQDSRGFMWFGTQHGLNRYDGYRFKVYNYSSKNPNSLSNGWVQAICEDDSGNLWIGTSGGGLNRFDLSHEQFSFFKFDPARLNGLSDNEITTILKDKWGMIWIGTNHGGLIRLDPYKKEFSVFQHRAENRNGPISNAIFSLYQDRTGSLWIGTDKGLDRMEPSSGRFYHYNLNTKDSNSLNHDEILALYQDHRGGLWVASEQGLNYYDRSHDRFVPFPLKKSTSSQITPYHIKAIIEDRYGIFWFGTRDEGVLRYDPEKRLLFQYKHDPLNPNSLSVNTILSLFIDRSENLWIGTLGGGIDKFPIYRKKFIHFKSEQSLPKSLNNDEIFAFCEESENSLLIGTYGGGLNKFNRKTKTFRHFLHDPNDPKSLSNNKVRAILKDRRGRIWVGTEGGGLDRFDPAREIFTHYRHDTRNPNSLSTDLILSIQEDREGYLWIGTNDGGLNRFDPATGKFLVYRHNPNDPISISNNTVYAILEDRNGDLWLGTRSGLNLFHKHGKRFVHFIHDPKNRTSISGNLVIDVFQDHTGTIWVGTDRGMNRYIQTSNQFVHYTTEDGLPDNFIYAILEDDRGNLWLSTNRGLSRFDPETETFKNFDKNDGLQGNEFNHGARLKCKDGTLLFGGINGFNLFHPDSIKGNFHLPEIVLTDFQLFNKSVSPGRCFDGRIILSRSIISTKQMKLSHKDRVFSFEFAALHYTAPEKNEYAYIMEGFEKEWNYVGNRRFATYTNLPPGSYTFRVRASNNDGIWNNEGIALNIEVAPPFYLELWFKLLGFALLILFTTGTYSFKVKSIKRRNRQLEKRVEKRTAQLQTINRTLEQEIVERKSAEAKIERLARFPNEDPNPVMRISETGKILYANKSSNPILNQWQVRKGETLPEEWRKKISSTLSHGEILTREIDCGDRFFSLTLTPITQERYVNLYGLDITQRKQAEDQIKSSLHEKEILLKEIHHRVKNNLQVISSLLYLQSKQITNMEYLELFRESQTRIKSMALIHEKLYQSKDLAKIDFGEYVSSLVRYLFQSYKSQSEKIKLKIEVEPIPLNLDTAIPCGLIINELISNSLKYAFPEGREGEIQVKLSRIANDHNGSDEAEEARLVVQDDGIGLPKDIDFYNVHSLGLRLVNNLSAQIGGTIEVSGDTGTKVQISFKNE